jgi:hypothetical protein
MTDFLLKLVYEKAASCSQRSSTDFCVGRLYPFYRPRSPLGRVGLELYSVYLDPGTGKGWGVSATPRPLSIYGKEPVPIVQEAGWAPGPVWTGAENLVPTGIRFPDRPARSQSLYRLSYPPTDFSVTACYCTFLRIVIGIYSKNYVV